ncbi:MAG TPA: hypothetical protein VNK04_19990, partial [Gemmataceae bacterium]|nr:hypothetical protein [Gemmataceae bacterium]
MSTRLRLTRVLFVCLTALVLATFLQSSDALERPLKVCGFRPELLARNNVQQASSLPPSAPVSEPLTLPTDWLARKKIETAVDYIKEQQWPEAVRLLQAILDAREDTFLQVEEKDTDGRPILRYTSARVEAERLVGSLPPAGMEYYQLHAGRLAADRLKEARNDAHLLAEVARRYFHTKAGAEALTLLGVHHLDRGRSGLAADCFRRLLHRERTEQLTPLTLFQAAMAFHQAGDLVHEELAWRRLVAQAPGGLRLGRQVVSLERLRKELDRMPRPAAAADWPLFRGNPARTGCGDGDIPWLEPRWQIATAERPETRRCIETGLRYQEGIREPVMPAFFPVTAGNKVIYRSHGGVAAVDVRTGHELWKSPLPLSFEGILRDPGKKVQVEQWMRLYGAFGLISSTGGNAGPAGGAGIGGIPPGNLGGVPSGSGSLGGLPTNAWASTLLFNNCVQGTLSTDHRRVYAVEDLPLPPPPELIQD